MTEPILKEDIIPALLAKKEPLTSLEKVILRSLQEQLCPHCESFTETFYPSGGKDKICESCFDHYSREKDKDESQEDYETRLPLSYEVLEDLKETAQGSEVRYEVLIRCALNLIRNPDIKNTWTEGDKTIVLLKGNCQNCGDYVEYNEGTEEVCSNCEEY